MSHSSQQSAQKISFLSEIGTGPVSAVAQATVGESGDAADNLGTTAVMNVNDIFEGTIGPVSGPLDAPFTTDSDWIRVDLDAGTTYVFTAWGINGAFDGLVDGQLTLRAANGTVLSQNDDAHPTEGQGNPLIQFTAATSGTHFIDVTGFSRQPTPSEPVGAASTGDYRLQVADYDWSPEQVATFLTETFWGRQTPIRFDAVSGDTLTANITALGTDGARLATIALEAWTQVTGINFSFTTDANAQLRFNEPAAGQGLQAFAGPGSFNTVTGINSFSNITISADWLTQFGTTIDSYSFQTYMHEIGHALGLGHAGYYDGSATYGIDNIYGNDSIQMSIMSYFSDDNPTAGLSDWTAVTPMIADILAIRKLYGAHTTLGGDTIWGFGNTVGGYLSPMLNGETTPDFGENAVGLTILDDGGIDTMNLSPLTDGETLDLRPGAVNSLGGAQGNVVIAEGTVIERALMGLGHDNLTGNAADNFFKGNEGHDTLIGLEGNDTLSGNNGDDSISGGDNDDRLFGGGGHDTLLGGSGQDAIVGGLDHDSLKGDGGNDTLEGQSGDDTLFGGTGEDRMLGGSGRDLMAGNSGNDSMSGGSNDDRLFGGSGDDTMNGDQGEDLLRAGANNDILSGGEGDDTLRGEGGNDRLEGDDGNDTLDGGDGADLLKGGEDNDFLAGRSGNDTLAGNDGNDLMFGGGGNDKLFGGVGEDTLNGGSNNDLLSGSLNNDVLNGNSGNDTLDGGDGNDTIKGNEDDDLIFGRSGNDLISGNGGDDRIFAGASNDRVFGGSGDDTLDGGSGSDYLDGGTGTNILTGSGSSDTFVFRASAAANTVTDFQDGSDMIRFAGGQLSDLTITQNGSDTVILHTGDGGAMLLENVLATDISAADFDFS